MANAEFARKRFFDTLQKELEAQGNPFSFARRRQYAYAVIGRPTADSFKPCVAIDFLYQKQFLRINVYIENDISLYSYLKKQKDKIEEALEFQCIWNEQCEKGKNTRRIIYKDDKNVFTFDRDYIDYETLAKEAIPIIKSFVEVFRRYGIDC